MSWATPRRVRIFRRPVLAELERNAAEGFCELMAYMRLRELGETAEISNIHSNLYTRGQMDLFIAAEERFGFSSVMDWMYSGRHGQLSASEPWRVQDLVAASNAELAKATQASNSAKVFVPVAPAAPRPLPAELQLKSVLLGGKQSAALINQCALAVGETGKVQLAHTNLTIRCKSIAADRVTIEVVGSGEQQELRFKK